MKTPTVEGRAAVIYHANCYDGFGAAFAAWLVLGDTADYIPWQYGDPWPVIGSEITVIYLVDLNWPIWKEHESTVEIHHPLPNDSSRWFGLTRPPEFSQVRARFNMDKSGAVMTWEFFHGQNRVPDLLRHIQDRDLWKFELEGTTEVDAWLQSYPFDFEVWKELVGQKWNQNFVEGPAILRFKTEMVKMQADLATLMHWPDFIGDPTPGNIGYEVPVCNGTLFWSELAHELLERYPEASFSVVWFVRVDPNGELFLKFSLRSEAGREFDVSELAKRYGGGGHALAAGFERRLEDFCIDDLK
jgi:hypothetical protein